LTVPTAQASSVATYEPSAADYYINYAPPMVEDTPEDPAVPGSDKRLSRTQKFDRKFKSGNPAAGRILAARERQAIKTGRNPADFIFKNSKQTRTAKLLTLLVEFNDSANDDFSGFSRPRTVGSAPDDCVTEPAG
jgi:immune inhibitor A